MKGRHTVRLWALATYIVVLAGCSLRPQPALVSYLCTVEKVDEPIGDYYTPGMGPVPMTYLYLRTQQGGGRARGTLLRVDVPEIYIPPLQGSPGDSVSFTYASALRLGTALWFPDLQNYRIVSGSSGQVALH